MERVDDKDLFDEVTLWRRVLPNWVTTEENGQRRPQSIAFVDRHTSEVSVFVANLTTKEKVLDKRPNDGIIAFAALVPRSMGGIVAKTPEEPDPAHRVLCYSTNSQMKRAGKKLTEENIYSWIVMPSNIS